MIPIGSPENHNSSDDTQQKADNVFLFACIKFTFTYDIYKELVLLRYVCPRVRVPSSVFS